MPTSSIDGLGSGLDTSGIINQLMAIERLPQQRLQSQRLGVLSQGTAWGQIGVALGALKTSAAKVAGSGPLATSVGTSSLPTTATVTAGPTASIGTHTLVVQGLAAAGSTSRAVSSPTAVLGPGAIIAARNAAALGITNVQAPASADPPAKGNYSLEVLSVSGTTAEVKLNGKTSTVSRVGGAYTVDGLTFSASSLTVGKAELTVARTSASTSTVTDLTSELNAAGGVASATVVTPSTGGSRMLIASSLTGVPNAVTTYVDGLSGLGNPVTVAAAADATVTLDGLADLTSPTNRMENLLPGVALDLVTAGAAKTTITISKDQASGTAAVKDLVTALNGALGAITSNTRYAPGAAKTPLSGDSAARQLTSQLQNAVSGAGAGSSVTLGAAGITLQRDGTYALDEAALTKSLADKPAETAALVRALGTALTDVATSATAATGVTSVGKDSATTRAKTLQDRVEDFDTRLSLTEARLRRTFTQLDTVLGQLRSQGGYLSNQLAGLTRRDN